MTRRFLLLGSFLLTATSAWSANDLSAVDEACHGELEDYDVPIGPDLEAFNQIQNSQMLNHPPLHVVSSVSAPLSKGAFKSRVGANSCFELHAADGRLCGKLSRRYQQTRSSTETTLDGVIASVGSVHGSLTLAICHDQWNDISPRWASASVFTAVWC